ncbi:hypothetical protein BABA_18292 [Neobacillus bataviensis LMG 21833]|uniref:Type 4 fimbrial biogenesis protein PilX N-terminal domain-containing protein n=1 Tax=Neobacillus bataviensis LMG 21833 TaxID=1117379 RepID=K6DYC4_9BACI|nr:prepilin-type N-terminal cleavage/methylation domain-containing protein [Neobacillus bataviensis]EKN65871.1 hypothetical protein BABA_18292 [Neobacillus bataviensis LMG 21833]
MKSEKGYTLILVMIIIAVTMVLAMALSAAAITTTKQFNKTDNRNKATDLAEMGVTHYVTLGKSLIEPAKANAIKYKTNFCTEFTNELKKNNGEKKVEDKNKYVLNLDTSSGKTTTCVDDSKLSSIKIVFSSKGITGINEEVELEGSFNINKNGGSVVFPDLPNRIPPQVPNGYITGVENKPYSSSDKVFFQDYQANKDKINEVNIGGGVKKVTIKNIAWFDSIKDNGNRYIYIQNWAIFSSINAIAINGAKSEIVVDGNAIFFGPKPTKPSSSARKDVCVTGTAYYKANKDAPLEVFTNFTDYFNEKATCVKSPTTTGNNNWLFDDKEDVKVIYK